MNEKEKAKRYDEAIKIAKSKIENNKDHVLYEDDVIEMFPELKESEDEKVRKKLLALIEWSKSYAASGITANEAKEMIAWVEKKGEKDVRQKFLEDLLVADDIHQMSVNDAMVKEAKNKAIEALSKLGISKLLGLEKQGEQKLIMIQWQGNNLKEVIDFTGKDKNFEKWFKSFEEYEQYVQMHNGIFKLFNEDGSHYEIPVGAWIVKTPDGYNVPSKAKYVREPVVKNPEPKFKVGDKIRRKTPSSFDKDMQVARIDKDYYVCDHIGKFSSEVVQFSEEDSYELIEQKPAENSEKVSEYTAVEKGMGKYNKGFECGKQRVLKYPEDYGLCKKYAWSEEDERIIEDASKYLREYASQVQGVYSKRYVESIADRIESLRPQNTWKPSDEQMDAVRIAAEIGTANNSWAMGVLKSMYQDLRKLREEWS